MTKNETKSSRLCSHKVPETKKKQISLCSHMLPKTEKPKLVSSLIFTHTHSSLPCALLMYVGPQLPSLLQRLAAGQDNAALLGTATSPFQATVASLSAKSAWQTHKHTHAYSSSNWNTRQTNQSAIVRYLKRKKTISVSAFTSYLKQKKHKSVVSALIFTHTHPFKSTMPHTAR